MEEHVFIERITSGDLKGPLMKLVARSTDLIDLPDHLSVGILALASRVSTSANNFRNGSIDRATNDRIQNEVRSEVLKLIPELREYSLIFPEDSGEADNEEDLFDLYISFPMTSLPEPKEEEYAKLRELIGKVAESVREHCGWEKIYSSCLHYESLDDILDPFDSASVELAHLMKSKRFMLIYPKKLHSSSLVECGIAIGLKLPSFYFVLDTDDLPYLLRDASSAFGFVQVKKVKALKDIPPWIEKIGKQVLVLGEKQA